MPLAVELQKKTIKELKDIMRENNIKGLTGNKSDLIDRILIVKKKKKSLLKKVKSLIKEPKQKLPISGKAEGSSLTFEKKVEVKKIPENDCPFENRPRFKTTKTKSGRVVKQKRCPGGKNLPFETPGGFDCCAEDEKEKKKIIKKSRSQFK